MYTIKIEPNEIPVKLAYDELKAGGLKLINLFNGVTQYSWAPGNQIEAVQVSNFDVVFDVFSDMPNTIDEFMKKYPNTGWHYGYVED